MLVGRFSLTLQFYRKNVSGINRLIYLLVRKQIRYFSSMSYYSLCKARVKLVDVLDTSPVSKDNLIETHTLHWVDHCCTNVKFLCLLFLYLGNTALSLL